MRNTPREQTFSALPSNSDIARSSGHFAFGPEAAVRQVCSAPISEADGPSVARAGASWDRLSGRLRGEEKLPAVGHVCSDECGLKRRSSKLLQKSANLKKSTNLNWPASEDRVTPGIARAEQNESALPQTADIRADIAGGLRRVNRGSRRPSQSFDCEPTRFDVKRQGIR